MHFNSSLNLNEAYTSENMVSHIANNIITGEATPIRRLNFFGESNFKDLDTNPLFIKSEGHSSIISQKHYRRLAEIITPVIKNNKKGLIIANSIIEAEKLQVYLSSHFPDVFFETSHLEKEDAERQQILLNSQSSDKAHYIITTKSLRDNIIHAHLTAYIDLNPSDSIYNALYRLNNIIRLNFNKINSDILFLLDLNQQTKNKLLLKLWNLVLNSPNILRFSDSSLSSENNFLTVEDLELSLDDSITSIMRDFNKMLNSTKPKPPKKEISEKVQLTYEEAKQWMADNAPEIKTLRAYRVWHTQTKPEALYYDPSIQYKDNGWISWSHFLESNNVNKHARTFLSYMEAKTWMASNFPEIKTNKEFLTWARTEQRPSFIPSNPSNIYKDVWAGMPEFLDK